jgi:hypothetical protein
MIGGGGGGGHRFTTTTRKLFTVRYQDYCLQPIPQLLCHFHLGIASLISIFLLIHVIHKESTGNTKTQWYLEEINLLKNACSSLQVI